MRRSLLSTLMREPMPQRILIDQSFSIASARNSGIERVVRSIAAECISFFPPAHCTLAKAVVEHEGRFYEVDDRLDKQYRDLASIESNVLATQPAWLRTILKSVCRALPFRWVTKSLCPEPGHLGLYKFFVRSRRKKLRRQLPTNQAEVSLTEGDLLILPDAYWARPQIWNGVEAARNKGAMVATIVHDLIPLTHPELVVAKHSERFRSYLDHVLQNTDLLLTTSETVCRQLEDYVLESSADRISTARPLMRTFTLGAKLATGTGQLRQEIQGLFPISSGETTGFAGPYLMVGTLEPRKNHAYALDAFDALWKLGSEVQLCIVGRVGMQCDELVERLRNHPQLGQKLFVFHDLTDIELEHCYRSCRAVVFPSIVEGFGLPIVESLFYGAKTLASDTPIHREVGGADCTYFDLNSPESLIAAIRSHEQKPRRFDDIERDTATTSRPLSWTESSAQLLDCCLDEYRKRMNSPRPIVVPNRKSA